MKVTIRSFAGAIPRAAPTLLGESNAQTAENLRLTSGALVPVNRPQRMTATALASNAQTIYWLGPSDTAQLLSWSANVSVAASPVSDEEYRIYYTGDGAPKKTNYALATTGSAPYPVQWYYMGVPTPTVAPSLAATSGSVPSGTYVYVFTYVTQFGASLLEESAPSPPATITLAATGGVTVTFPTNPPTANRNYVYKRVYRTTGTAFQLVAQVAFSAASYTDTLDPQSILGDPLQSLEWDPPPDDLQGVCALASGVLVGFRENELWFSEVGYPHAWPSKYVQAVDARIIGIKVSGNALVIATETYPYIGTGMVPDAFTIQKLPHHEPCVSARSMAVTGDGVAYVSRNGLIHVTAGGVQNVTAGAMTRHELQDYAPESWVGIVHGGVYYAFYRRLEPIGETRAALAIPLAEPAVGLRRIGVTASAVAIESWRGVLCYVDSVSNGAYLFDPVGGVPDTYIWKSKLFALPAPANFSCFQVVGRSQTAQQQQIAAQIAAQNAAVATANTALLASDIKGAVNSHEINAFALNGSLLQDPTPLPQTTVDIQFIAAGEVVFSGRCQMNRMYRLPSGFKFLDWEVQVVGQAEVLALEFATSPMELKQS